ncbi:MAG: shikimate dehydrogenase [Gloeomargaritaceae cyanobacterium C42_A2020_066]|nr:shikimate dehydrogenase [Gloeomargaritaceae cyanobacterium C42_A2020_066]
MITGRTKLLGVIGDPVGHSLSPVMHNRALAALELDYRYLPFPVKPADLGTALAGLAAVGVGGLNVTIPHKVAVLAHLHDLSPLARQVGAVNTLCWTDQGWWGTNTDVAGFLAPLGQRAVGQPMLVLGCGGAARAVVAAGRELDCPAIHVVGRDAAKVAAFVESWPQPLAGVQGHTWEALPQLLPTAGLVVNTTPLGMGAARDASPLSWEDLQALPASVLVYDLIYTPRPTRLLQMAAQLGLETQDGLAMLVGQGAEALEIWLGRPAPVAVMTAALETHLAQAI